MAEFSLSLHDAISRANPIWLHDNVQDRGMAVEWMENGSQGDTYPQLVIRIGQDLALSNKDAACLVRLLDNHESLDKLMRSTGLKLLPFSAIWIWQEADGLFAQRQKLRNSISNTDWKILHGYWRTDDEYVGGLLSKLGSDIYAALAGYYIITGGGLAEKVDKVQAASEWSRERIGTVTRMAIEEARFLAVESANAIFQRVLQNQ